MSGPQLLCEVIYRPPLGVSVICFVVALVVIALAFSSRRERAWFSAMFRLAALFGLGWLLAGPSATQPSERQPDKLARLAVLIDTSASMAQRDAIVDGTSDPATRLKAAEQSWLNEAALSQLRRYADVELTSFDAAMRRASGRELKPDGSATRLYESLSQVRSDATLIVSDGHDTTRGIARPSIDSAGRVFVSSVGQTQRPQDLAIEAWPQSDRLFAGQGTTITASIRQRGLGNRSAEVELLENGQVIASRRIELDEEATTERFRIEPALPPGELVSGFRYTTSVRLVDDEGSTANSLEESYTSNNTQDLYVQVSRDQTRVLLLEGEPYWDTRSLARLVGEHPRFDLTAEYGFGTLRRSRILGESLEPGVDPSAQLRQFDIVILGRRVERLVEPAFAQRLVDFVRDGGAVVFARGSAFSANTAKGRALLDATTELSPGRWGEATVASMRVSVADTSSASSAMDPLRNQALISELPGMLAATRLDGRKAASIVLLEQRPEPQSQGEPPLAALTTMRVGSGQAMAVLTEGLWRWELLPGVEQTDGQTRSAYASFWVRALQWLASGGVFLPGQDLALEADRLSVEPGETVTLQVSTRYVETADLTLALFAIDPEGTRRPLALTRETSSGTYRASYTPEQPGVTRFELTTPGRDDLIDEDRPLTARVIAIERSPERRDTSARPDVLRDLADASGGAVVGLGEVEPIIAYLQSLQAARETDDMTEYAFNTVLAFVWIVGMLGLEWIVRRRSGLR